MALAKVVPLSPAFASSREPAASDYAGAENPAHNGMIDANLLDMNVQGLISEQDARALFSGELDIRTLPGLNRSMTL